VRKNKKQAVKTTEALTTTTRMRRLTKRTQAEIQQAVASVFHEGLWLLAKLASEL
jgi:hypothetical protein